MQVLNQVIESLKFTTCFVPVPSHYVWEHEH